MTTKYRLACGAFLIAGLLAARVTAEEIATVKEDKLNVRGQPSIFSEVITQLKKGETVTILEEVKHDKPKPADEANWAKILLPANTPVWINASFVTNHVVLPKVLNVRSGPGENFSVIARVDKGTEIKEIRVVDAWMEIVAPTNAYAFVALQHLAKSGDKTEAPEVKTADTKKHKPAKTEVKPAEVKQPEPPPITVVETVKPEPVVVAANTPVKPVVEKKPEATFVEPKTLPAPAPKPTVDSSPVVISPVPPSPKTPPPAPPETIDADKTPAPPRIVIREGTVHRTISIQAPSPYRLVELNTGRTINYLYVGDTGLELKYYLGKNIRISGEEALDKRWLSTPLITIQTLEPLP